MLAGSTHPAILTNSRWRAVGCIDPRLAEKWLVTAIAKLKYRPPRQFVLAPHQL
jgi:hypothetical protein